MDGIRWIPYLQTGSARLKRIPMKSATKSPSRKTRTASGSKKGATKKVARKAGAESTPAFPGKKTKPIKPNFRRILVPIDFSESSRQVLCDALGFAQQYRAQLILLHVVEPVLYPADLGYAPVDVQTMGVNFEQAAKDRLNQLCGEEMPSDIKAQVRVRFGPAYQEITDAGREEKADLIMISTHGYTGLTHVFLGSTAERVIRHASCPVLTYRKATESDESGA